MNTRDIGVLLFEYAILLKSEADKLDVLGFDERSATLERKAIEINNMANELYELKTNIYF